MGLLEQLEASLKEVAGKMDRIDASLQVLVGETGRIDEAVKGLYAEMEVLAGNRGDLTIAKVVKMTGKTDETLRKHCMEGLFPNAYKVGRNWYIPERDLRGRKKETEVSND